MNTSRSLFCDHCGAANVSQATVCFACHQPLPAPPPAQAPYTPEQAQVSAGQAALVSPPPAAPSVPASRLNLRYHIISEIGQGGFGLVYKAQDSQNQNKLVAIKQINLHNLSPREIIDATDTFNREVRLLSGLEHPNLPCIYDHFTDPEHWYLVMDFIEGETLEEYLASTKGKHLPVAEVLAIGIQLCTVLGYLHTRQPSIIFRDVKPANIMRTPKGHLYLIDFGIARHFTPGQTKDTGALGSPGYAAPEQYGKAQTTVQTDIYGLGATLQTLLTGADPVETVGGGPSSIPTRRIPKELHQLLKQMCEPDARKRPQSMDEVKRRLQQIKGLARLVSLIATALLFCSFFLPWFAWSWSCTGSDCQAVTLSLKTHPPVSSGFSVASNGVSLVSASASVPSVSTGAYVGDQGVVAVNIDNFSRWASSSLVLPVAMVISWPLSSILMNLFKTSESAQPTISTKLWKKRGLARLISLYEWSKGFWYPDTWKKRGLAALIQLIAVFANFFFSLVANNGVSLVATCATVGDRAVFAVNTDSFRFPWLWLVLVISIVLFLSQILMNLFKTVARWEPPFTLMITAVALFFVEIPYMSSAFGVIIGIKSFLFSSTSCNHDGGASGSGYLYAPLTTSNPLIDATLHLSHGPSFGFWLGLVATLVVGGIAVVRSYRRSA